MFKTFTNCLGPFVTSSRCMRGLCDPMQTFGDGLETSCESSRQTVANLSHSSEIGA